MGGEMKPRACPFCGGTMRYEHDTLSHTRRGASYRADCPIIDYAWGAGDAIAAWNRRSPDPELVEALTGLEHASEQLAATRSQEIYIAMIDGGQALALLELDNARRRARALLSKLREGGDNG